MICTYELAIVYDTEGYFGAARDQEFTSILGESASSGSGFHQRDMQWDYNTRAEAELALERLKANVDGFEFSITHMHWDEAWTELPDKEMEHLMYPEEDCPTT